MSETLDLSGLTPEQVQSLQTAAEQAKTLNDQKAAEAPAPEPAPAPEAAPAPAPEPTTLPEATVSLAGPVADLLSRLNLERTGNVVGIVVDWLAEHGVKF